jgi:hypothetical protein
MPPAAAPPLAAPPALGDGLVLAPLPLVCVVWDGVGCDGWEVCATVTVAASCTTAARAAIDAKRVFLSMSRVHLYEIDGKFIDPLPSGSRISVPTFVNSCFWSFDDIAGTAL